MTSLDIYNKRIVYEDPTNEFIPLNVTKEELFNISFKHIESFVKDMIDQILADENRIVPITKIERVESVAEIPNDITERNKKILFNNW